MKKHWYLIIIFSVIAVAFILLYFNYILPMQKFQELLGIEKIYFQCWLYNYTSEQTDIFNSSLPSSQKVMLTREKLNQNYTEFVNGSSFKDEPQLFSVLMAESIGTNFLESFYSINKNEIPEYYPEICELSSILDENVVSKILFTSITMTQAGMMSAKLQNAYLEYCSINSTNNATDDCNRNFTKNLDLTADEIRNSIPEFKIRNDICSKNRAYCDIKEVEKDMRDQLNTSSDPISKFWKSVLVDIYSNCSEQVGFVVKRIGFPPVTSKANTMRYLTQSYAVFALCSTERLNDVMLS